MIKSVPRIPNFYFWIVLSFAIFKPLDTLVEPSPIAFDNVTYFNLLDSGDGEVSLLTHWLLPELIYPRLETTALSHLFLSALTYPSHLVRAPPFTDKV